MSQQFVSGTLASGGSFRATPEGVEIFAPAGQSLAVFRREAISGVSREGQVVTFERHNDTIVTITAASVAEADDLEQFVAGQISGAGIFTTPEPEPVPPSRPYEPEPPPPAYTPPEAPPQPEPEMTAPAAPPTPAPSLAEQQIPGGPGYSVEPARAGGGRRWLLWGCLGCGGLILLCLIISGILLATGAIDVDDLDDDDDPTATIAAVTEPTATTGSDSAPTTPADSGTVEPPADGEFLQPGQSAQVEGVDITLLDSRIDEEPVFEPVEGNEFLVMRFEIVNNNAEEYIVATILQFALESESGESYAQSFFAETVGQLDGALAAGETIEGEIAYEVPQGGGPYIVRFEGFLGDEEAAWLVEPGN